MYNIYCDESCHLEHDGHEAMLFGALTCPTEQARDFNAAIRDEQGAHGALGEIKWNKVSPSHLPMYLELVDLFFATPELRFRALVVDDKSRLDHDYFNKGSHDSFYYKMYYYLLRPLVAPGESYRVFVDIKDTRSQQKIVELRDVLNNTVRDFEGATVQLIQHIRSHEVALLQLADLMLGAVAYRSRGLSTSAAKVAVLDRVCEHAAMDLRRSTPPWEENFNVFHFTPRGAC